AFFDFIKNAYWAYHPANNLVIPSAPEPLVPAGMKSGNGKDPRWVAFDISHTPNTAFFPYLLTDDPYYLEETQALATLAVGYTNFHAELEKLPGLVYPGEVRSFAWSIRNVFLASAASPATPPAWLLPKSYFDACLS